MFEPLIFWLPKDLSISTKRIKQLAKTIQCWNFIKIKYFIQQRILGVTLLLKSFDFAWGTFVFLRKVITGPPFTMQVRTKQRFGKSCGLLRVTNQTFLLKKSLYLVILITFY